MNFELKSHTAFVTRVLNTRIMALFLTSAKKKISNLLWTNTTGPVTVAKENSIPSQKAVSQAKQVYNNRKMLRSWTFNKQKIALRRMVSTMFCIFICMMISSVNTSPISKTEHQFYFKNQGQMATFSTESHFIGK